MKKIVSPYALLPIRYTRIIPLLLFSAMVGVQLVSLAAANFISSYPPEPDTNPPTISILSPENKTYTVNNVSLAFGVSEHIYWASYSLDGQANVTIRDIPLIMGIGTFGNTTLIGLPDGTHSLIVYAMDEVGNRGSSDMIYFTIDTTPPSISILSPENKTYETTDIPLAFTTDESASWMGYSLDEEENVTISGNTTLTGLSYGDHNITIYVTDDAGNTGTSEIIYFSIAQKTEPQQPGFLGSTLPIEYGYVLAAETVAVTVIAGYFFLKRKKLAEDE